MAPSNVEGEVFPTGRGQGAAAALARRGSALMCIWKEIPPCSRDELIRKLRRLGREILKQANISADDWLSA